MLTAQADGDVMSEVLWTPDPGAVQRSRMEAFRRTAPGAPSDYEALWRWSVEDLPGFWSKVWDDCGVIASARGDEVLRGDLDDWTAVGSQGRELSWFPDARLNMAENLLRRRGDEVVLIGDGEGREPEYVTGDGLRARVARAQQGLRALGVGQGDRVAALMPNCVETVVLAAATAAIGAIWSSCSPDFGPSGVVDRFGQIRPAVLCTVDGYRYGGRRHDLSGTVRAVLEQIDSIGHVVAVDFIGGPLPPAAGGAEVVPYEQLLAGDATEPDFVQLPFDHPLAVLYSSGTTGAPKSIVHSVGGTLLKHLSEHRLHTDLGTDSRIMWFTTCGWMMWNWLVSALASEATVVCYDGSPTHPDAGVLWRLAERERLTHLGVSPKLLAACAQAGLRPRDEVDLSALRQLLCTGAPLSPEQFDWVYDAVGTDLQLASVSGGTDLVGCFASGVPTLPVRRGELQARTLGMAVAAFDDRGEPVVGQRGELVCTAPFPSMPVRFWGDDGTAYTDAYFTEYPGVWTHGDYVEVREHGGLVFYGRSDTTLNPGGVRIGTAELYRAVETMPEVVDSVVVARPVDGDVEVVLCVQLGEGATLDGDLEDRIRATVREATTPRHVPRHIVAVSAVPYTISGKKVEKAVRQVIAGEEIRNRDALANPEALDQYASLPLP